LELNTIISGCLHHDRKCQRLLYEAYYATLYKVCYKYIQHHENTEDVLHDVFIEIFNSISSYKYHGSFEGWMKRIATFKSIDFFKTKNKFKITDEDTLIDSNHSHNESENFIDHQHLEALSYDDLMKIIETMPNQYQMVFCLYEIDGLKHAEIAEILGIKEGTSKSNLLRGREFLKKKLMDFSKINQL
jgi:RNA polymerase sigma factor (sigma-70 family)